MRVWYLSIFCWTWWPPGWMACYLASPWINMSHPQSIWKELLAPQVELDSVRQPTSGGVSLWEFWLWSPQGNQPDARQMARLLVTSLHFNITPVPRADSLVCKLQLHVHIEPLWGREAGYHRTGAECQHRTMEACTHHQSSNFPQCAGHRVRRNARVKAEVKALPLPAGSHFTPSLWFFCGMFSCFIAALFLRQHLTLQPWLALNLPSEC